MEMMRNVDETSLDEKHIEFLKGYDFSSAKVDFIYSVPGYHSKTKSELYGYKLLSSHLKKHFNQLSVLESNLMNKANLLYQTSAIGILNPDWLKEFISCVCPNDKSQEKTIKIMFPSMQTVSTSILGTKGAGTIFFPKGVWDKMNPSLKSLFLDLEVDDLLKGALLHSKVLSCTVDILANDQEDSFERKDKKFGWFYIGSHNFTAAAWGKKASQNGTHISNYECGVLFPPREFDLSDFPFPHKLQHTSSSAIYSPWINNL
eukprot:TRINITY_DN6320_c0_g1_i1.p1 TRINITY_DN6320_c0_g1~~TRINITY_DN6320_c0_g1_i1.p1  ORF type:complete len:260 (+),score=48.51 TRINITY_DN6320_c0_g1_i1:182-961(+)